MASNGGLGLQKSRRAAIPGDGLTAPHSGGTPKTDAAVGATWDTARRSILAPAAHLLVKSLNQAKSRTVLLSILQFSIRLILPRDHLQDGALGLYPFISA